MIATYANRPAPDRHALYLAGADLHQPCDGRIRPLGIRSRSGRHPGHRYRAIVWFNNERYYLGTFATPTERDAAKAAKLAWLRQNVPKKSRRKRHG